MVSALLRPDVPQARNARFLRRAESPRFALPTNDPAGSRVLLGPFAYLGGCRPRRSRRGRQAFSLIEAVIAVGLTVMAAGTLLMAVSTSQQTTDEALRQTIAAGMAEQLMDEILGQKYCADPYNGYETSLSRSSWEAAGAGRERYNDIDDYNLVRTQPPTDPQGIALGRDDGLGGVRAAALQANTTLISRWRQEVDVYYVSEANPSQRLTSGTSDYRMVEVRITEEIPGVGRRQWAKLQRVVSYVPPVP